MTALTPIASSTLKGVGYDPDKQQLTVEYHGGDRWTHDGVTAEKHASLMGSASPGRYFNDKIKGVHPARKVG